MFARNWSFDGAGDGDVLLEKKDGDVEDFKHFQIQLAAGSVRVFGSLDGTTYPDRPLVLSLEPLVDGSDNVTEPQGTFTAVATSNLKRIHHFFGSYKAIKIVQKGATAAPGILRGSEE